MNLNGKKTALVVFIILIMIFSAPKAGRAAVPVFETNPKLLIDSGITSMFTTHINIEQLFEWVFKLAAEVLKRQILNMIVDQIVSWIQGGGKPRFITDWPGFFKDAVDQAGGKFIKQIGLSRICSPIKPILNAGFIPVPTFSERTSCTLGRVGANLDAFLKDFKKGGWVAWNEMMLRPQNNVYGAYILAWDQYEIEKSAAQKAAEAEAQASKGFLSARKCLETRSQPDGAGGFESYCAKETIVTPGSVIGDVAAKAVGSDIDYIVNAQDLKAYVSAIANAILNRLFSEGLALAKTAFSGGGSGGGGGAGNATSAASQCSPLLGTQSYQDCVNAVQAGTNIVEFQKSNLISLAEKEITAQNQYFGAKQATLSILDQTISTLDTAITTATSSCSHLAPALVRVKSEKSNISDQMAIIQSNIIAVQKIQQEAKQITDPAVISSLYAKTIGTINPSATQSLVIAAQQETVQKQQALSSYQQQANACIAMQAPPGG